MRWLEKKKISISPPPSSLSDPIPSRGQVSALALSTQPGHQHLLGSQVSPAQLVPRRDLTCTVQTSVLQLQRRAVWAKGQGAPIRRCRGCGKVEGRRKAFRGKRPVSKGMKQEWVWQVWGLREEQQVAPCCSPVFGITAVLLGLDYSADSGGWNVCSTERAQKTKMEKQVWSLDVLQDVTLVPGKGGPIVITPLAAMTSGSKNPGVPGMVQRLPALNRVRQWPLAPALLKVTPHVTTDQNSAWAMSMLARPEKLHCWENKSTIKQLHAGHCSIRSSGPWTQAGP